MRHLLSIAALLFILSSCQQKAITSSLSSNSPDGKTLISVKAKKSATFDPYFVSMEVKDNGKSIGSLQFEISASTIDSNNVKFNWQDSQHCTIELSHSDGEKRVFSYRANGANVILQELK